MQITTLSFFRFRGIGAKLWAFCQMQLSKPALARTEALQFGKLLGSGTGEGFDLRPNWSTYAILATWPSMAAAQNGLSTSVFAAYQARAVEHWSLFLSTMRTRGEWDGDSPFQASADDAEGPVAVLTRATMNRKKLVPFWKSVPSVSELTRDHPGLHFKLGVGELPAIQLMTFSVWQSAKPLEAFAYQAGPHREAMQKAKREGWFSESLFARFRVVRSIGTWEGDDPMYFRGRAA